MHDSKGNRVGPIHRQNLEHRMNIVPIINGHNDIIVVFTLIKYIHTQKVKINDVNLGMILPKVVPHHVQITVPIAAYEHKIFSIQILNRQKFLGGQRMIDG